MGKNFGTIRFRNARASGQLISQLGSGTYDYLGFFGTGGYQSAVEIGSYQDTTIVVDSGGTPQFTPFGGLSYCTNNKFIDTTHVRISGAPKGVGTVLITKANKFSALNLAAGKAPDFINRPSGTLLIQYTASGVAKVNTFNAKLYAYNKNLTIVDGPTDVTLVGFEINASGKAFNLAHSGVWHAMQGRDNALLFLDHSSTNGYRSAHTHLWVASLSCKANSVGILNDWNIAFSMQFA